MNYRLLAYNCLSKVSKEVSDDLRDMVMELNAMKFDESDFNENTDVNSYWKAMERVVQETLGCSDEEKQAIINYFLE